MTSSAPRPAVPKDLRQYLDWLEERIAGQGFVGEQLQVRVGAAQQQSTALGNLASAAVQSATLANNRVVGMDSSNRLARPILEGEYWTAVTSGAEHVWEYEDAAFDPPTVNRSTSRNVNWSEIGAFIFQPNGADEGAEIDITPIVASPQSHKIYVEAEYAGQTSVLPEIWITWRDSFGTPFDSGVFAPTLAASKSVVDVPSQGGTYATKYSVKLVRPAGLGVGATIAPKVFEAIGTDGLAVSPGGISVEDSTGDKTVEINPSLPILAAPTAPELTTGMGSVSVRWDGSLVDGAAPAHLSYVYAEEGTSATGPWVRMGQPLNLADQDLVARPPVGDTRWYRLTAMDTSNRPSLPGPVASITVEGVELPDLSTAVNDFLDEINGKADAAIVASVDEYAVSTSATVAPTTGWSTAIPSWSTTNYIWRRTRNEKADGTFATETPAVITGNPGATGGAGTPGRGITSTTITYQAGASGTAAPTGTWTTTIPSVAAGQYLWTRTVDTYTDASTVTSYSIGKMGENGSAGVPGTGVASWTRFYYLTTGAAPAKPTVLTPPAPWSTTEPNYVAGTTSSLYFTDRTVLSTGAFSYSDVSISTGFEAAKTAYTRSTLALDTANGKNKTIFSTSPASGTVGYVAGDIWFQKNGTLIIGQWEFTTSWQRRTLDNAVIANLNAGKITAGFLDVVNRIKSGSIATDKLLVSNMSNLLDDPGFEYPDAAAWTMAGGTAIGATNPRTGANSLIVPSGVKMAARAKTSIPVEPGEQYRLGAYVRKLAGTSVSNGITLRVNYGATAAVGTFSGDLALTPNGTGTTYVPITGIWTVPATAKYMAVEVIQRDATASQTYYVDDLSLQKMYDGQLIVDGAITAFKLDAEEIWAAQAWLDALRVGVIEVDMLKPGLGNQLVIDGNLTIISTQNQAAADSANAQDAAEAAQQTANAAVDKADTADGKAGTAQGSADAAQATADDAVAAIALQRVYYDFGPTGQIIGDPATGSDMRLHPNGLQIRQNGVAYASFENGVLIANQVQAASAQIANHKWEKTGAGRSTMRML